MTGGQLVVKMLEQFGVEHVFGLSGHTNIGVLDAMLDSRTVQYISVRHEQVAAHAADAYYKASHKPAVCLFHIAPGLMNATTGVAHASADGTPMIVIAGDVPSKHIGHEAFQEILMHADASQSEVYRPFVKRAWRVTSLSLLPHVLVRAFNIAYSGRSGPVLISVPMDFFSCASDLSAPDVAARRPSSYRVFGDPVEVRKAVDLLASADRAVIYAGGGVLQSEAATQLVAFAEYFGLPVATTLMGKGVIPEDHELALGVTGLKGTPVANEIMRSADVMLAIGTRFPEQEGSSWDPRFTIAVPPTKLIHIDIDGTEIGKLLPVTVGVIGDAAAVLEQMLEAARARSTAADWRGAERMRMIQQRKSAWNERLVSDLGGEETSIHPSRILRELRGVLPRDGVVISDVGWSKNGIGQQFPVYEPLSHIASGGLATMGWAVPAVLGAKLARPDKVVVGVMGDGGFTSLCQALPTAVEYGIAGVWLIMNDYAFGSIRDIQANFYERRLGVEFAIHATGKRYNPDFAALARSMGADAFRVEEPRQLRRGIEMALSADRAFVLEVVMRQDVGVPSTGYWDIAEMFPRRASSSNAG